MRMAFLTVTPTESLAKFLLPRPITLSSVAKGGIFCQGTKLWFLKLEVRTATLTLWALHASESTDRERGSTGVIHPD